MLDYIKTDDIMLKWKADIEVRLQHLYKELKREMEENCQRM